MKKLFPLIALLALILSVSTSCVSTKKIRYFQGADTLFVQAQDIVQQYEMRIKPADQIIVSVSSKESELLQTLRQNITIGSGGNAGTYGGSMSNGNALTVSNNGEVNIPHVGKVKVADLTCDECAAVIEEKLREAGIVKDAEVIVRLMNARVVVLGAVGGPKVVNLTSERNTISDILAQCGDVSDGGFRHNIQLFREQDGKRMMYELDMTKATVFQSPAYYVQQNDLIYVIPNRTKNIKASPMYTFMSAGSGILAFITTIISFILLIKRTDWSK